MEFILYGREGGDLVEGVANFNYLPVEGLGEIGEDAKKGRGGPQSGGKFLQGGDTDRAPIWIGDLGIITGNR